MWNWVLKKGFFFFSFVSFFSFKSGSFLWTLFVLSLTHSLSVIPCFLLQSLPVVVLTGCFYLKREREREGESQIVQVFAPISLVIFVVLTGFCLMRESHKFLSTLEFPSYSSYSTHYFYFYFLGFVDLCSLQQSKFFLFF